MNQFCVYFVGFVDWVLIHTAKLITSLSILRLACKGRSAFVLARKGTLSSRREKNRVNDPDGAAGSEKEFPELVSAEMKLSLVLRMLRLVRRDRRGCNS